MYYIRAVKLNTKSALNNKIYFIHPMEVSKKRGII